MSQKIRRKDLKRNELADTVERTVGYVSTHRRGTVEAAAIGVGIAVLIGAFFVVRAYRENKAGKELSAALAILETPVGSALQAPGRRAYGTAAGRDRDAEKHLSAAADLKGTRAGRAAAVILAARGGKPAEAEEVLSKAAKRRDTIVGAVAEVDAAKLLAAQGKTAEAIDRLKRAIERSDSAAPKDALLFALAEIYDKTGSPADARATYQKLVTDFPASPYVADARSKLAS